MNRRGISIASVAISATMFLIVLFASPFIFNVLNLSGIGGVEGFFAKLVPFVMLWTALRTGAFVVVGE